MDLELSTVRTLANARNKHFMKSTEHTGLAIAPPCDISIKEYKQFNDEFRNTDVQNQSIFDLGTNVTPVIKIDLVEKCV